jgi:hypothetical protein
MSNYLEIIFKEVVVAKFKVPYRYLLGELRKTTNNLSGNSKNLRNSGQK